MNGLLGSGRERFADLARWVDEHRCSEFDCPNLAEFARSLPGGGLYLACRGHKRDGDRPILEAEDDS